MSKITWDNKSYLLDGERKFLVSGEFHYFRVPKEDWEKRLILLKEAGGNCVATYVPWILHEPVEGDIRFGDIPQRDLEDFLQLCKKLDLLVVCRPGPYQYSELKYDGLPGWLCENYQEILARDIHGNIFRGSSVSYLHPVFLEKVKKWFDVVNPILAKYMVAKEGPVAMVQIDNELMGIHEWYGGFDYNRDTMGFGTESGRYPVFLKNRYSNVESLNLAYGTSYGQFNEVYPWKDGNAKKSNETRRIKDYQDFYFQTISEYIYLLYKWMREAGIDCQIVHNSANPYMNSYFLEAVKLMGKDFLLGSDHYYNLNQDWNQNNPTPQYAINVYYSNEMLRLMGYPPTIFELPGGSLSDWPPITKEDLLCCYMTNMALGMKGSNYYIFTGGPNPEGASHHGDLYDYNASIGALGDIRPTYESQMIFGKFLEENAWLAGSDHMADFHIGLDWEQSRSSHYWNGKRGMGFSNSDAWKFLRKGLMTTAFCASYSCNLLDLSNPIVMEELDKPLVVATSACMSEMIQNNLVEFVKRGGKLILSPVIPQLDENFNPCTILSDYLMAGGSGRFEKTSPVISVGDVHNILMTGSLWVNESRPSEAQGIAFEETSGTEIGWKADFVRGGKVIWLGFQWSHAKHEHSDMLRCLLAELECDKSMIRCSNPNVWTSIRSNGEKHMLFVMNLLSAKMTANIEVSRKGKDDIRLANIVLNPMEVKYFEIEGEIEL